MNLPRVALFPLMDAAEPLRHRAPAADEEGRPLSDFMMLIPGLRDRPRPMIQEVMSRIHSVLACFSDEVVFAELNIRLNLLWVSVRPVTGLRNAIACAVQDRVPEAKLVTHI